MGLVCSCPFEGKLTGSARHQGEVVYAVFQQQLNLLRRLKWVTKQGIIEDLFKKSSSKRLKRYK
jgi:hypothetical protein